MVSVLLSHLDPAVTILEVDFLVESYITAKEAIFRNIEIRSFGGTPQCFTGTKDVIMKAKNNNDLSLYECKVFARHPQHACLMVFLITGFLRYLTPTKFHFIFFDTTKMDCLPRRSMASVHVGSKHSVRFTLEIFRHSMPSYKPSADRVT